MFHELEVVRLKKDQPSSGLAAGAIGTVVMVYDEEDPPEYEVEFVDVNGRTLALLTLRDEELEAIP